MHIIVLAIGINMSTSEKRNKFISLAENRVTRAIRDIRLIGNLSNKNNYEYSEEDVEKIFTALDAEVRALKKRFQNTSGKREVIFKL